MSSGAARKWQMSGANASPIGRSHQQDERSECKPDRASHQQDGGRHSKKAAGLNGAPDPGLFKVLVRPVAACSNVLCGKFRDQRKDDVKIVTMAGTLEP